MLSINNGSNETWVDTGGAIHQMNTGVQNDFQGSVTSRAQRVSAGPLTYTGNLLQINRAEHGLPAVDAGRRACGITECDHHSDHCRADHYRSAHAFGSSTISYVCAGTDFDGNLINGTTATITNGAASWAFPVGYEVVCPWTAGVNTYQIYRTAGGPNQGLMAQRYRARFHLQRLWGIVLGRHAAGVEWLEPAYFGGGDGDAFDAVGADEYFDGRRGAHCTCGTAPIGSGSLWLRTDGGVSTSVYSCAGTTWTAVTIP